MTTLDDYADGERPEPVERPHIKVQETVRNPTDKSEKVGKTVRVLNRGDDKPLGTRGYFSTRVEADNLFEIYDSYPISESILDRLREEGVSRVLIAADEAGRDGRVVYEFTLEQYLSSSNRYVWERTVRGNEVEDPQRCPPREEAIHVWEVSDLPELFHAPE